MPSLYIHIPFCKSKCPYCGFISGLKPIKESFDKYVGYLCREMNLFLKSNPLNNKISTLYIGGGTPSLLSPDNIERLFSYIYKNFNFNGDEITFEANPDDVTKEIANIWKNAGINRVSLGFQSMQGNILKFLGRRNTASQNMRSMEILRNAGFTNISIDLIGSIRGEDFIKSISGVLVLDPEHISVYQLSIEEKTLLFQRVRNKEYIPLSDKEYIKRYWKTNDILEKNGYDHYEISNYAFLNTAGNKVCTYGLHNGNYWDYGEYIGIGLGASGFLYNKNQSVLKTKNSINGFSGMRWTNSTNINEYFIKIDKNLLPQGFAEEIDAVTAIKEYLMLGLRKKNGVDAGSFQRFFNCRFFDVIDCNSLQKLSGFLEITSDNLHLTSNGINVADSVIREIWELIKY